MGGDSAVTEDDNVRIALEPKVFVRDGFVIGTCGGLRAGQVIQYEMEIPRYDPSLISINRFMSSYFARSMRESLKDYDLLEDEYDTQVLVGFKGHLFVIDSEFGVDENIDKYASIGSGRDYALGALFTNAGLDPELRLNLALKSSAYFSASVRGPFTIMKLGKDESTN